MNPILVVDDNEQILNILTEYIRAEGWPALSAKTGEEALALFEAASPSLMLPQTEKSALPEGSTAVKTVCPSSESSNAASLSAMAPEAQ